MYPIVGTDIGVARIFDWGGPNHKKRKKSSQYDLGLLIGGTQNVVGDQFRIREANQQLT